MAASGAADRFINDESWLNTKVDDGVTVVEVSSEDVDKRETYKQIFKLLWFIDRLHDFGDSRSTLGINETRQMLQEKFNIADIRVNGRSVSLNSGAPVLKDNIFKGSGMNRVEVYYGDRTRVVFEYNFPQSEGKIRSSADGVRCLGCYDTPIVDIMGKQSCLRGTPRTVDSSCVNKRELEAIFNNDEGVSVISHRIDSSTSSNNISEMASIFVLPFTFYNGVYVEAVIRQIAGGNVELGFKTDAIDVDDVAFENITALLRGIDTPGVAQISRYINDQIKSNNQINDAINQVLNNEDINPRYTVFLDRIVLLFANIFGIRDTTRIPVNMYYNVAMAFKTMGDMSHIFSAKALGSNLITTDGFLHAIAKITNTCKVHYTSCISTNSYKNKILESYFPAEDPGEMERLRAARVKAANDARNTYLSDKLNSFSLAISGYNSRREIISIIEANRSLPLTVNYVDALRKRPRFNISVMNKTGETEFSMNYAIELYYKYLYVLMHRLYLTQLVNSVIYINNTVASNLTRVEHPYTYSYDSYNTNNPWFNIELLDQNVIIELDDALTYTDISERSPNYRALQQNIEDFIKKFINPLKKRLLRVYPKGQSNVIYQTSQVVTYITQDKLIPLQDLEMLISTQFKINNPFVSIGGSRASKFRELSRRMGHTTIDKKQRQKNTRVLQSKRRREQMRRNRTETVMQELLNNTGGHIADLFVDFETEDEKTADDKQIILNEIRYYATVYELYGGIISRLYGELFVTPERINEIKGKILGFVGEVGGGAVAGDEVEETVAAAGGGSMVIDEEEEDEDEPMYSGPITRSRGGKRRKSIKKRRKKKGMRKHSKKNHKKSKNTTLKRHVKRKNKRRTIKRRRNR